MAYALGYGAHHMAGFGFGFFNFLGTILFIVAIVWVVKFFVRGGRGGPPWAGRSYRWREQQDDALRAARERFASGEIGREQYDEIRFYRAEESRTRRDADSGGSGLGLPIAKALVEAHGGSISAANHQDGGAVLEIRLPA